MIGQYRYKQIDIWSRLSGGVVCYRCFEVESKGFCVQSADFYPIGGDFEKIKRQHDKQYVELLSDCCPLERSALFPTIEEAIDDHVNEFLE